ncbi:MAG: hypothetical protein MHM6MM_004143 [Cercozoa sp. M6MM]
MQDEIEYPPPRRRRSESEDASQLDAILGNVQDSASVVGTWIVSSAWWAGEQVADLSTTALRQMSHWLGTSTPEQDEARDNIARELARRRREQEARQAQESARRAIRERDRTLVMEQKDSFALYWSARKERGLPGDDCENNDDLDAYALDSFASPGGGRRYIPSEHTIEHIGTSVEHERVRRGRSRSASSVGGTGSATASELPSAVDTFTVTSHDSPDSEACPP